MLTYVVLALLSFAAGAAYAHRFRDDQTVVAFAEGAARIFSLPLGLLAAGVRAAAAASQPQEAPAATAAQIPHQEKKAA